ncbi:hypothetical protein DXG01_006746 [Tephrocybe rancida]|nr:hypothetical protein DXG01_006746 [Tephrocybe rancida]
MNSKPRGSSSDGNRDDYPQVGPDVRAVAGTDGPLPPLPEAGDLSNITGKIKTTAGANGPLPPLPEAGDLSNIRKIETTAMTPGPRGVFADEIGDENKRESVSRLRSSSSMFSMFNQGPEVEAEPQRKRLVRKPRSKPSAKDVSAESAKAVGPVTHLQFSANRQDGNATSKGKWIIFVHRKVRALLNKLTMEKFDSISDQIVALANESENENDGTTLVCVTQLIFEHAMDGATWAEMYARLCRKMMERIIPTVYDRGIRSTDGKPITGAPLFRKYLLNRCQEEFESGWLMEQAVASKAAEDQVVDEAAQRSGSTETALYSDEYSAVQKAKRRGLGLMKFIGELFKLQMLTERIMHECLKKLLGNVDTPKEEDLESCCVLMKTVGFMIDTPRAAKHMGVYFARITELRNSPFIGSQIRFLLQDVIDLCERKWVDRDAASVTITQIHENVRPPPKAGHLSNVTKINKIVTTTFGLSNIFSGKEGGENKGESASTTSWSSDMFSMLTQDAEPAGEPKDPEPERKQLVPAPQSQPSADNVATGKAGFSIEIIKEQAAQKAIEDAIEFFATRHFNEAESYFAALTPAHHSRLVEKLTAAAVEAKESQVQSLVEFFARVIDKKLCSPAAFEQGFMPIAKIIDDVKIDVPKAFTYFVTVVKSAGLDEERVARLAAMTTDATKFLKSAGLGEEREAMTTDVTKLFDADVLDPRISASPLPLKIVFIFSLVSILALFFGI